MILEKEFFKAPNAVFDNLDLGLNRYDRMVYLYLCRCSNQGADAFPGYSGIARKCGISRATARRAVKSLEDKGFITVTRRPKSNHDNESNLYQVHQLPSKTRTLGVVLHRHQPSITGTLPLVKQGHQSSAQAIPYKEPIKKNHSIKDTTVEGNTGNTSSMENRNYPSRNSEATDGLEALPFSDAIEAFLSAHGSSNLSDIADGLGIRHIDTRDTLFNDPRFKKVGRFNFDLKDTIPIRADKSKDDSPESHPGTSGKVKVEPLKPNIMATLEERLAKQNIEVGVT